MTAFTTIGARFVSNFSISRFQANLRHDDLRLPLVNLTTASVSILVLLENRRGCFFSTASNKEELQDGEEEENGGVIPHLYRSRGQYILRNEKVLDSIVRHAGVLPTDRVLEVGSGTGNLTLKLLRSASSVVAVEIDPRMVDAVRQRAARSSLDHKLTVIRGDVLNTELPQFDKCVSNIPYNISSPLLAKLFLGPERCFASATLLLQKEFAQRLLTEPGDPGFSRLAVNLKLVATVDHMMKVSKREFIPNPKVDSSLVKICPRSMIPEVNLHEWLAFTHFCFGKRNKTLGAIFRQKKKTAELFRKLKKDGECCCDSAISRTNSSNGAGNLEDVGMGSFLKERLIQILKSNGFEDKRPSKLSQDELLRLLSLFNQDGIYFKH